MSMSFPEVKIIKNNLEMTQNGHPYGEFDESQTC